MKKNKIIFTICICGWLYAGCFEYSCPEFDYSDYENISYRLNDTIKYVSLESDTLILIVSSFEAMEQQNWTGCVMDYECPGQAKYIAYVDNAPIISENFMHNKFEIGFYNDSIYKFGIYGLADTIKNDLCRVRYKNYEINGINYKLIFEVKDLSGSRRIDRFIKASGKGIVEFHEKINDITWRQIGW